MEEIVGIEVYLTKTRGIGGKIKERAEDFVVEELPEYPAPLKGKFVVVRITSKNWETNRLVEYIASSLRIPAHAIGYAGIKDRRAVTTQLMSIAAPISRIKEIRIKDVEIEILYKTNKPIGHGMLKGNKFKIWIRNVEEPDNFYSILKEIESYGGFPNFFGIQRFGIARPITHTVGKHLLNNEIKEAVMAYIANPIKGEDEECYKARKFLQETMDFEEALKIYPKKLNFERRIIKYLAEHNDEWENALLKLPSNLIRIFIHAYQSYIFNRILSARIREGYPINEAIEGDIIIKDIQSNDGVYANEKNISKINKEIKKGKCFPTAAVPGYATKMARGEAGEIEAKIMEEEGVEINKFRMPYMPWLASAGMRRSVFVPLRKIKWGREGNSIFLSFSLPRGCYATSLLREFMKADIYSY